MWKCEGKSVICKQTALKGTDFSFKSDEMTWDLKDYEKELTSLAIGCHRNWKISCFPSDFCAYGWFVYPKSRWAEPVLARCMIGLIRRITLSFPTSSTWRSFGVRYHCGLWELSIFFNLFHNLSLNSSISFHNLLGLMSSHHFWMKNPFLLVQFACKLHFFLHISTYTL